ncbi:MAG: DUF6377 domain-containing protein [Ferruginibacter sp.]
MKICLVTLLTLSFFLKGYAQNNNSVSLDGLTTFIQQSYQYDVQKVKHVDSLKSMLKEKNADQYNNYLKLYEEYSIFNYDSAFTYAQKMQAAALASNDNSRKMYAKIKMSFILLSSGMFKEVFDSLRTISLDNLDSAKKAEYFTLMARCYYDLADYDRDNTNSPKYNQQANSYVDSSLKLYADNSFEFVYYNGLKNIRSGNKDKALLYFEKLMNGPALSLHQLALTASTLSDVYIQNGQLSKAIDLLIAAAVSDIKSSTKETSATLNLSTLLFRQGDFKNASICVEKAMDDALFYGSRQRKVQLSSILPLIEAEKVNSVEREKRTLTSYAIIVTLLLLLLAILTVIIFRQVKKLKQAKQLITDAHHQQQVINSKLMEANKIKEEYIGYFFSDNSEFHARIEKFKNNVERKIADRKLEEIKFLVNNLNLKRERDELLTDFDKIFLKLFPNFILEFNALFKKEDWIILKDGELLNTDLRIFALIRMGIYETDKIARILEYSVNTINTYKTKIKNKSIVVNEDFEHKIMDIRSV